MTTNAGIITTKPHYPILDGLRGVAALIVVAFHIFEAHAINPPYDQIINHGYLAVDFFFALSGFVIGYAYDDRWEKLSIGGFFKRRLERLQPMVVMGSIIGALCFYFGHSSLWPNIHNVPLRQVIALMVIGFTLIPVPVSWDIRGWQEMHPLDGPGWSLFFEYIANILYAIGLRRLSKPALTVLVIVFAALLIQFTVMGKGDVIGGWSLTTEQLRIGFTRLLYPFFAGLLLSRVVKPGKIKHAFLICSILLGVVLMMPRIGGKDTNWMNGLYESVSIILIFPLIIYLGASGITHGKAVIRISKFLGDISYPIYITHYAFIYVYTGWVADHRATAGLGLMVAYGMLTFAVSILIAYITLKYYDEPVRAWLKRKWK